MMKHLRYILSALLLMTSWSIKCSAGEDPKRELRGVWIATVWGIDWPAKQGTTPSVQQAQKAALSQILDKAADMNLNMVCFQVRGMADAMYESSIEPWSSFVSGKRGTNPGWDPLEWIVDECHRRGIECHAWINPFRWSSGTKYSTPADGMWKKNRWLITHGKTTIFNPALEDVRQHIVDVCRDIITRYRVDGIIFDDYFYPQGIPETTAAPDYDDYRNSGSLMSFGDWRRANIHKTIADVHAMIEDVRPDIRFGISPAGVAGQKETSGARYRLGSPQGKATDWQWGEIYSDPLGWLYQHTVDYVSPQLYWPTHHATAPFEPLTQWWSKSALSFNRHFFSSHTLADYKGKPLPASEFTRQVELTRANGDTPGFIFYSAKFLDRLDPDMFETPALLPSMPWKAVQLLNAPVGVYSDGNTLTWDPVPAPIVSRCDDAGCDAIVKYAVYAVPSRTSPSRAMAPDNDGIDSEYFLGITYDTSFPLPTNRLKGYRYAVTALDGYGIESEPAWNR